MTTTPAVEKISLSEEELFCIFVLFSANGSWGGSEETLLRRADLYTALRLESFEAVDINAVEAARLGKKRGPYQVSRADLEYLIGVLVTGGQSRALGLVSARLVRELRAIIPAAPPTPGGIASATAS